MRKFRYRRPSDVPPSPVSATDLAQYVDRHGVYHIDGMDFEVRTLDAKLSYGRLLILVTPETGEGSKWATENYLTLKGKIKQEPE